MDLRRQQRRILRQHSGGGTGKVTLQDFTFSTYTVDKASPLLFKNCCSGEHMKKATLVAARPAAGSRSS